MKVLQEVRGLQIAGSVLSLISRIVIELSRANRRREVKANKNAQHSANVGFGAMRPQAEAFGESIGFVLSTALRVSNIVMFPDNFRLATC